MRFGSTTDPGRGGAGALRSRLYASLFYSPYTSKPLDVILKVPGFTFPCGGTVLRSGPSGFTDSRYCEMQSKEGFGGTVRISCAGLPAPAECVLSPPDPYVPADGKGAFYYAVRTNGAAAGTNESDLVGKYGETRSPRAPAEVERMRRHRRRAPHLRRLRPRWVRRTLEPRQAPPE